MQKDNDDSLENANILENLERFALAYGLVLETKGEVGIGRPCVGFLQSDKTGYIDYNAFDAETMEPTWPYDGDLSPCLGLAPDVYHKYPCMAVLVHEDDYDAALWQLNEWANWLESVGSVEIYEYERYPPGSDQAILQKVLFGRSKGYAIRIRRS